MTSVAAVGLATGIGATAFAADLPVKAPIYTKAPVAPWWSWSGFYLGGNVGYSWGKQSATVTDLAGDPLASSGTNLNGVIGGGQIGYNYQINSAVLGIEADLQGSGQRGHGSFGLPPVCPIGPFVAAPPPCVTTTGVDTDKLEWFGTVRGRLGYAAPGRWLPYVTGGWAYGDGKIDGTTASTVYSNTHFYSGWTAGGGIEWAFADHWSTKLEYLYADFGKGPVVPISPTLNLVTGHMTDNIVRAGVNYRFY
jgi:outer membrane immunogenic protein